MVPGGQMVVQRVCCGADHTFAIVNIVRVEPRDSCDRLVAGMRLNLAQVVFRCTRNSHTSQNLSSAVFAFHTPCLRASQGGNVAMAVIDVHVPKGVPEQV
eukprot:symbB.v1.2.009840.t1/scaffold628.1/size179110/3